MLSRILKIIFVLCMAITIKEVYSHGNMLLPINWFDSPEWIKTKDGGWVYDYVGMKSEQQCTAGSQIPRSLVCSNTSNDCDGFEPRPGGSCRWFTNYTFIAKATLFDSKLRTWEYNEDPTYFLHHPWRAPGSASIDSPCGVAGGNIDGCGGHKCGQDNGGFAYGLKAEDVDFVHEIFVTNWTRGDVVEVVWGIHANHGGGYSLRLCKLPDEGRKGLTEECFQKTPLEFVGDTQWVQYGENKSTRVEIPAVRTNQGTTPVGSQWTKNPIPACKGSHGGAYDGNSLCLEGTQFPPPAPSVFGWGYSRADHRKNLPFSIIDQVRIPKDLDPGNYVLSFRWDCEQTSQVWNTCSSVRLH